MLTTRKGTAPAEIWQSLHDAAMRDELQMAVVRASDVVGPGIERLAFGTRFSDPLRRGKAAQAMGDVDTLHSVTFVPDLAEALIGIAEDDMSWCLAWHAPCAPAVTQRRRTETAAATIGRRGSTNSTPTRMLRGLGKFVKPVGVMVEMLYEFDGDFVVDSSAFTDQFAMDATPLDEALAAVMGVEAVAV